jgi:hypothetical protein
MIQEGDPRAQVEAGETKQNTKAKFAIYSLGIALIAIKTLRHSLLRNRLAMARSQTLFSS